MAAGMTLVILTAGIDLSVGAILALCAMCGAAPVKGLGDTRSDTLDPHKFGGMNWLVALLLCMAIGTAVGFKLLTMLGLASSIRLGYEHTKPSTSEIDQWLSHYPSLAFQYHP